MLSIIMWSSFLCYLMKWTYMYTIILPQIKLYGLTLSFSIEKMEPKSQLYVNTHSLNALHTFPWWCRTVLPTVFSPSNYWTTLVLGNGQFSIQLARQTHLYLTSLINTTPKKSIHFLGFLNPNTSDTLNFVLFFFVFFKHRMLKLEVSKPIIKKIFCI